MLGNIFMLLLSSADFFHNYFFSKIFFQKHYQSGNSLDPDQDQRYVGPDLGPNCLQGLSADKLQLARKELIVDNIFTIFS